MTASPQQRSTPRTILVVDDDPDVRGLLRAMIERATHRVLEATGGAEALGLIGRVAPDLILLDVHMPGLDGIEACRRIKADPATRAIPVLMLTAAARDADRQRVLSGGAEGTSPSRSARAPCSTNWAPTWAPASRPSVILDRPRPAQARIDTRVRDGLQAQPSSGGARPGRGVADNRRADEDGASVLGRPRWPHVRAAARVGP